MITTAPPLDLTTQKLLSHLWRAGAFAYYWTASEARRADKPKEPKEKLSFWFETESPAPPPGDYGRAGPRHLYFSVNPTLARGSQYQRAKKGERDIAAINTLFGEFDFEDFDNISGAVAHVESLHPAPSVIVSSGGGLHCYWLLAEPFVLSDDAQYTRAQLAQYAWVDYVKSDDDAKDIYRVLRIPETLNYKSKYGPDYPKVEIVKADFERLYSLAELEQHCKPGQPAPQARRDNHIADWTTNLETAADCLKRLDKWRVEQYRPWLEVGMSLKGLGAAGLQLWDQWSQGGSKYHPDACERKWNTFKADGLGLGSLIHWANEDNPRPRHATCPAQAQPRESKAWTFTLGEEAKARRDSARANLPPQLTPLEFENPVEQAELDKCEITAEHHIWTSEGGKGKTFFYCNDPARCALCRERHTIKLRFYLEEIARLAYIDQNGNAAYSRPELNEAGDFFSASRSQGIWYGKVFDWDFWEAQNQERRAFCARYKRQKPGGFIKPEVYPILDRGVRFVVLSLAPFEDMQPIELTDDLLQRIAIGAPGLGMRASLLFGPARKQLELALPRYSFEIPKYLNDRGIVATVPAPHSVLFTGPIKPEDVYSSFNTKAETFDDIGLILEEVALKSIDTDRLRGIDDHAPDYVIQSIHIVPEAKPAYLAVYNAGREGDIATIKKFKRPDLPKLPTLKSGCADKGIYPKLYIPLTTHGADLDSGQSPETPFYYAHLEHLLEIGAI